MAERILQQEQAAARSLTGYKLTSLTSTVGLSSARTDHPRLLVGHHYVSERRAAAHGVLDPKREACRMRVVTTGGP